MDEEMDIVEALEILMAEHPHDGIIDEAIDKIVELRVLYATTHDALEDAKDKILWMRKCSDGLNKELRAAYDREAGWIKNISIAKDAADKWESAAFKWEEKYWETDEGRAEYDRAQEHEEETF